MQDKTTWLKTAAELGLKMNVPKTEIMHINNKSKSSITLKGHILEEVNKFAYLGSYGWWVTGRCKSQKRKS